MIKRTHLCASVLLLLSGCANVNFDQHLQRSNQTAYGFTQGELALVRNAEQRAAMKRTVDVLLLQPISQNNAVRMALFNSPELQALIAQNMVDTARAAQNGRIANPTLTFERLRLSDELELGRLLSFGLLDVLTLPKRMDIAQSQVAELQLRLTRLVVSHVTQVRIAWIKAVTAQQNLSYAHQVNQAAKAGAELARRMQAVGNFNKLQRAREQAFYADAAAQLAAADLNRTTTREELVRLMGLTASQAHALQLSERLPDLPKAPATPEIVSQQASQTRLDIQLAHVEYETAAKAQGLTQITSLTDIELGVRRDSVMTGTTATRRGYEINVRLPLFDNGNLQRDAMNAQTLAAANRLEATLRAASSHLRQSYASYRTAYDLSQHYRDEVVPLRQVMAEENVLLYNGMFIGAFELLADMRDQVKTVMAAIDAQQQFWLSDAALQATLIGLPTTSSVNPTMTSGSANNATH